MLADRQVALLEGADHAVWFRMALPTLDSSELTLVLREYGIEGRTVVVSSPMHGADNRNVFIDVDDHRYVLRLYGVTASDEIDYELQLVEYLVTSGFPTPRVHRRTDGALITSVASVSAALFDRVPGTRPTMPSRELAPRVATLIARLHALTEGRAFPGKRSRTDVGRLEAFERLLYEDGHFASTAGVRPFHQAILNTIASFQDIMRRTTHLPWGALHHDPHRDNLLVDDTHEIVALLDFDEAYSGYFVLDIAALIAHWARTDAGALDSSLLTAMVAAYQQQRPLTPDECYALPTAILVFFAADAADYLLREWRRTSGQIDVQESRSLQAFYTLRETNDWRAILQSGTR